jgi:dihydroxy-acid dehydratase
MDAKGDQAWQPAARRRRVPASLQAYSMMTTSAAKGAVRDIGQLKRR